MATFNWLVASMPSYSENNEQSNVVFQVNWECHAQEGDFNQYKATSAGSVPVTYIAGSSFTPYDQLTQEQVWGWINPSIDRTAIEADLQAMIDEQKTPTVTTPTLPWSN